MQDPGIPELVLHWLGIGVGVGALRWFLIYLGPGSGVSQSLCWPTSGQGWGSAGPRIGSGLLCVGWACRGQDCGFCFWWERLVWKLAEAS